MDKDAAKQKLQKAGLTGNEAKVYWVLLNRTGLTGGEVARKAAIDRSLTYTLLNNLTDKGLVTFAVRNKKKVFSATNPANLLTPVLESEHFLQKLIPELQSIQPKRQEEQAFKIYEGTQGIKSYVRLFTKQKRIGSFGGTGKLYDFIEKNTPPFYENQSMQG